MKLIPKRIFRTYEEWASSEEWEEILFNFLLSSRKSPVHYVIGAVFEWFFGVNIFEFTENFSPEFFMHQTIHEIYGFTRSINSWQKHLMPPAFFVMP